jgi:hypothetical protein
MCYNVYVLNNNGGITMFKEIYKKVFKSRNLLSAEEVAIIEEEQEKLKQEIEIREKQIQKFKSLMVHDPDNQNRYVKRMKIHSDLIDQHKKTLEEIEIKLLDK